LSTESYPITKAAIYGIAHDLGAPMRHVAELARLVATTHSNLPEDTLETLELIRLEGEKGSLMLDGMLSLETAKSATVDRLTVKTDTELLDLAIAELIDNAQHYGEYAKIQVSETTTEVTLTIKDGGPGIDKDNWLEALRPFVRLNGPLSKDRLGLGLTRAAIWCQRTGGRLENAREGVSIALKRAV